MDRLITLSILICYLTIIIIIGLYSARKIRTATSFFLADRSLGWLSLSATVTATVVGGSATIATAKLLYLQGLPALWLDIGAATGLIILGIFIAKKVRKTGLVTLPEITGHLFDENVRKAAAYLILFIQIAWVSLLIQGTGSIITILLPFDYRLTLTFITFLFIFYTLVGGQYAVVYTDIIQFFLMIIGICGIAAPLLFLRAASGIQNISLDLLRFPVNNQLGFLTITSFFFMMVMPHIVGPDIYAKVLSAKNQQIARKAVITSGIFRIVFAISIGVIGISAMVLVPGLSSQEAVFAMPRAISQLGPFLAGPILAAFVSVMLSSADSVLLSAGTVLSVDITRRQTLTMTRIGIFFFGLSALILALYLQDIIETLKLAYTVFTSGLTFPILFGFYKKKTRVSSEGAMIGLILGGSMSLLWFFLANPYNIDAVIIGMGFSIAPLFIFRDQP